MTDTIIGYTRDRFTMLSLVADNGRSLVPENLARKAASRTKEEKRRASLKESQRRTLREWGKSS